jgi:hypothetical protein
VKGPKKVVRTINPEHIARASKVEDRQIGPYMDQMVSELQMRVDAWRYKDAPPGDVDTVLDGILALWTEAGVRGFT